MVQATARARRIRNHPASTLTSTLTRIANIALTVTLWGSGAGEVRSSTGDIACGAQCSDSFRARHGRDPYRGASCGIDLLGLVRRRLPERAFVHGLDERPTQCQRSFLSAGDAERRRQVARCGAHAQSTRHGAREPGTKRVRSEIAIKPKSGVFYFEGHRLVQSPWMAIGIATRAVSLEGSPSETGQGFNIETGDGSWFDPAKSDTYGFVVDYRSANPIVHLIAVTFTGTRVAYTSTLSKVTEPLYIFVGGLRRRVGPQVSINAGNDIANFPFFYDPVTLLRQAGISGADALILGWGDSHVGVYNAPPSITVGADQTVPLGSLVTLNGTARDVEDGDLSSKIQWGDRATPRGNRLSGVGARFALVRMRSAFTSRSGRDR